MKSLLHELIFKYLYRVTNIRHVLSQRQVRNPTVSPPGWHLIRRSIRLLYDESIKTEKCIKKDQKVFMFFFFVTKDIASRAAKATMSAHETTPGHAASTSALTASIISNPLTPSCPNANFSEIAPLSTRIEPSHPWKCVLKTSEGKQWRRRKVALYLDKAIVKMEAEKYGWEVWVGKRSSRDNSFDDWLGLRACIGVKPDFEISNRDAEENYDQRQS